jgi:hypothetical protein
MERLFIYGLYDSEHDNYMKSKSLYICKGFMYGSVYDVEGYPAAVNSNIHNHVDGNVYLLNDNFDYLDNYEGDNYERRMISIYTEESLLPCWVYILKKF